MTDTNKKASLIAVGLVAYLGILVTLISLSGPSMRADGICCHEGISVAYGLIWMGLGLGVFFFVLARIVITGIDAHD